MFPELFEPRVAGVCVRLETEVIRIKLVHVRRVDSNRDAAHCLLFITFNYVVPIAPAVTADQEQIPGDIQAPHRFQNVSNGHAFAETRHRPGTRLVDEQILEHTVVRVVVGVVDHLFRVGDANAGVLRQVLEHFVQA